ncbi:MAG: HU family DNA-binding protein [Prevotella sp.]|nr:HU family DNA-binding protein [Prevotella sp.]
MATIKDIAKLLVEKHKMSMAIADDFLQNMVEVINDGLLQDRIVKIKGFGTFKLQEVKERSSVNVNTGERVVIAAHDKITFTPDAVMRDMVNKPFAHFETVIVDGNETPAPKKEEPKPVEEPKKEEPKPVEEPKKEEPKPVEEPKKVEPEKEEPQKVEPKVEVEVKEEPATEESSSKLKYVVAGIICAVVLCVAGYFASNKGGEAQQPQKVEVAKTQQEEAAKKAQAEAQAKAQAQQAQAQAEDFDKYNKDARVKYGAYSIVGVDTIVTVYKGQTLKGISKAYLGQGMECYVEAFNETKEVKPGDKVRIPKLKVKKRSKK